MTPRNLNPLAVGDLYEAVEECLGKLREVRENFICEDDESRSIDRLIVKCVNARNKAES